MNQSLYANANPEKRFFIDLIIRDISLEDAILDLLDNSIDSLIKSRNINIYEELIDSDNQSTTTRASVNIVLMKTKFVIKDNCGGIPLSNAKHDVFRFGHPDPNSGPSLSVFGIGMKRAIFKIGKRIKIKSQTISDGFTVDLDVDKWVTDKNVDWKIPYEVIGPATDISKTGTTIEISDLRDEIQILLQNNTSITRLKNAVSETYPFYLGKYIDVTINNEQVPIKELLFGESNEIKPAIETWREGDVEIIVICGMLPRTKEIWTSENSGWYMLCNGRVVVYADKTRLTGWGISGMLPQFMPKNRGFLGMVFFTSNNPEMLPWNTTKRGLNTESPVFIRAVKKMSILARPLIQFQNKLFESNDDNNPKEFYQDSINKMSSLNATQRAARISNDSNKQRQVFSVDNIDQGPQLKTISFKVTLEEIERVRKRFGRMRMSAREVGQKVFKYFLEREC